MIIFCMIILHVSKSSFQTSKDLSMELATLKSSEVAKEMEGVLAHGIFVAEELSETFISLKELNALNRTLANKMLLDRLKDNDNLIGIWTCWQPDAFVQYNYLWPY